MGLMNVGGGITKKLLATYETSSPQSSFSFSVPKGYKYIEIKYLTYINESTYVYSILVDSEKDIQSGTLSTWYGSGSGTLRGRRVSYSSETRTLSFSQAGRFDSAGWASDNRVCPVKEIWGINE